MSQSTARAARQATGEPYFKDVKRPNAQNPRIQRRDDHALNRELRSAGITEHERKPGESFAAPEEEGK